MNDPKKPYSSARFSGAALAATFALLAGALAGVCLERARVIDKSALDPERFLVKQAPTQWEYFVGYIQNQKLLDGLFHSYFFYTLNLREPENEALNYSRLSCRALVTYPSYADIVFRSGPEGEYRFRLSRSRDFPSGFYKFRGAEGELLLECDIPAALEGVAQQHDADELAYWRRWNFWYPHRYESPAIQEYGEGEWFELAVELKDDTFEAFVSGQSVGAIQDTEFTEGQVGWGSGNQPAIYFDWVQAEGTKDGEPFDILEEFIPIAGRFELMALAGAAGALALWLGWTLVVACVFPMASLRRIAWWHLAGMWLACLPLLWPRSAMFLQNANPTTFHWRQYLGTSLALLLGAWALYWIFHARFFRWSVDDEKPVFESGRLRKAPLCALVLTLILLTFFPTIFGSSRSIAATSSQKTNTNLKKENFKKGQTIFFSDKNLRSPEINTVLRLQPERIIDVFIGDASRENQIGLPLWDFLRIDVPQKTVSLRHSDGFLKQDSRPMSQEELDKLEFNIILNVPIYANTGASVRAEVNRDKIRILSHVVEGKVGLVIHQGKAEVIHLYTQQTLPQFKSWPDFWSTERIIFFAFSFVILTASLFALLAPAPFWKTLAFALLTLSPAILFLIFYNGDAGRAMAGFLLLFAGGAAARWYWGMTQCGKAWVYNVLTVGSLIIVGVCVEWALRSHPHYNTALKGDWFFGEQRSKFVFRPHVEGDLVWNSYTHQYTFRDVKYSNEKPADTTRVVCLGGSSTHGIGVGAPELRFCNKMEAKLEERSGQNFEVVNGGLVSYTSFDNLLMMKRDILYLNPDVVVLNFGVNDGFPAWWLNASQPETYAQQKAIWDNKNGAALALARSRTLRALVQQAKTLALPWRTSLGSVHVPLEKYKEILKEFAQLSREHDFKLVFVCEPSWESRQPGESYYEKYYNAMREVAQRENIICVEPLKAMRERPFDKFFVDVVHLSEAGHELMSELLTGAVRQALAAGEDQSS